MRKLSIALAFLAILLIAGAEYSSDSELINAAQTDEENIFTANQTLGNPGGDSNSYKLILNAHNDAAPGDETQTSSFYTVADPGGGFGGYLVISAPAADGSETAIFAIKDGLLGFATDNSVDIGASIGYRPKDIYAVGDIAINGGISLKEVGTGVDSEKVLLEADNAGTTQTASLYVIHGADPYLRVSVPNDAGAETGTIDIHDQVMAFVNDDTTDIGATGANRPKDIFLAGDLDAEAGSITAQTGLITDTGDVVATAGAVLAGTTVNAGTGIVVTTGTIATGNELAPDVDSGGICLNQGANDNFIQTFKSSDVAHGVTSLYETDTYGAVEKEDDTKGGIKISGIGNATAARAIELYGVCGTCTGSRAGIVLNTVKKNGTSITGLADAEIIATFSNANTAKVYFYGNGDQRNLGDLDAAGGLATELTYWYQDNVAVSQTAVVINMDGNTGRAEVPTVRAGSVIGIAVYSNEARTAGTLTVDATIDGAVTGLTAVLDGTNPSTKVTTQAKDTDAATAGQRIGVKLTTDGAWAPTTADITVVVLIEQ